MIGFYGYWVILTYLGVISAVTGIYYAIIDKNTKYAVICLVVSGICDMFDGTVARTKKNRTDREKSYGIQIDSLADVVAFGILPVVIGYSMGLDQTYHMVIMSVYILAVLIRLAYYNVTEIEMQEQNIKRTHYTGLPVTSTAVIIPIVYLILEKWEFPKIYDVMLIFMSIAYLVKIEVPKLRPDEAFLKFLYNTFFGRVILKLLIKVFVSRFAGRVLDSSISKILIKGFIKSNSIDMGEYKKAEYKSFNEFFTREIEDGRRPFPNNIYELPAPCDGKLSAYPITADSLFKIKKSVYDVNGLLQDSELANEFMGGTCLIFRLTPEDYHRYYFIDDGEILSHKRIKGVFHTVRSIALSQYKVFIQNAREYTVMQTRHFGKIIQIEIGAMFIGKISNRKTEGAVARGEEKGMFEFGGSTVMILFKKDAVSLDETIFTDTASDRETAVRLGAVIGKSSTV